MQTHTIEPAAAVHRAGRGIALLGAAAVAAVAVLPWVTVRARIPVDLDLVGVEVGVGEQTVSGLETAIWPYLLATAAIAAVLAASGFARRFLLALGVVAMAAGAGLIYYLANVVQIKTSDRGVLEQTVADLAVATSVGPGPYVLLGAGAAIAVGALTRGGRR